MCGGSKNEGRKLEDVNNNRAVVWDEDNEAFNLDLEKSGVDCNELSKSLLLKQRFCSWVEEWEKPLLVKNDIASITKLLQKYKSMVFNNPNDKMTYTAYEDKLVREKIKNDEFDVSGDCSNSSEDEAEEN